MREIIQSLFSAFLHDALATNEQNEQSNEILLDNYAQRADKCVRILLTFC